jgi:SAM-dependent methyltransferase
MFIEHKEIPNLLYYWPQLATREYYIRTEGQCHTIPALNQPRFHFLKALLERPMAEAVQEFIAVSKRYGCWVPNETNGANYGRKMMGLYEDMKENGIQEPISLLEGPPGGTGRLILQEGNHRAVIAHFLGRGLEATVKNATETMKWEWGRPPEKRLHLYQSIFVNGEELVAGARRDVLERINCVRPEDLKGKSVLVLGCNNGRDCFLAGERGATKIVGVDIDAPLLNAALREATYYGYPTDFIQYDLTNPLDIGEFDTVLAFSIYNSVADHGVLAQTMRKGQVIYFEGHVLLPLLSEAAYRERYAGAIGSFRNVEPVYSVDDGIRRMYRMER